MSKEITAYSWIVTNKRTGIVTRYNASNGIPVTPTHVKNSPYVQEWAKGDEIDVFPAYNTANEMQTIFCITGFNPDDKKQVGTRCFGFYYEFGKVIEATTSNKGDMNERNWYSHLVVEEFHQGLWNCHKRRWFFVYQNDEETGKWVSCECPASERNCSGYAMG